MYGNYNLGAISGWDGSGYGNSSIPLGSTAPQYSVYNPSTNPNVSQYGTTVTGMETQQPTYVTGQPGTQYAQTVQPGTQYVQAGQPGAQYVQAGEPGTQYVQPGQTGTQYVQVGQPGTQYVQTGQPETQYLQTGQPETQYVQTGQPETQYVQTGQPDTQYVQTGQSGTQYVQTGLPGTEYIQTIPHTSTVGSEGGYINYNTTLAPNAMDSNYGTTMITDPQYSSYQTVPTSHQDYDLGGTTVDVTNYGSTYDVIPQDTRITGSGDQRQPSEVSHSKYYPDKERRYSSAHGRSQSPGRKNSKGRKNSSQRQNQRLNELRQSEFNTVVSGSDDDNDEKHQSRKKGAEAMDADSPGMGKPPRRKISKGAHQRHDDSSQPQFVNGYNETYKISGKTGDNSVEKRRVEQPMDYDDSTKMDPVESILADLKQKQERKESANRIKNLQQRERSEHLDARSRDLQQRDRTVARMKQMTNYEASESDITDTERSHVAMRRGSRLPPHLVSKYQDYYRIDQTDDEFQDPVTYHKAKRASRAYVLSKAELMLESRRQSRIQDLNSSDEEGQRLRKNALNIIFRMDTSRTSPESEYMENKIRPPRALTSPEVEKSRPHKNKSKSKYLRRRKLQPVRNRRLRMNAFQAARFQVRTTVFVAPGWEFGCI
ncbi:uncharacterized protein LOC121389787 [Gigantopelta aegis]|uniref:uncharacterized protein LOC121389787 n=1 Tax=Gigantopelta aegis TaxID=1735272 RepID=UPI001B88E4AF|nr:uncharacterized protein LOC121389787 [Gigantopelta aegis]